ncbi:MADCA protein, partial [Urocolius indicus]|nr:MADCA protein [Urocolius indicus]
MELTPLLLILVLSLLWGCNGQPSARLVVMPQEPVVQYKGSVQLNCSLACAGGTVQWKGLDTNLGNITTFPTHSILHINSAVVTTAGTKICQGSCQGQRYQRTVDLKVYALPDRLELEAEPSALEAGQPGSLRCSAHHVYPLTGLQLTWYRGDRALEEAHLDVTETDEELFDIVSVLPVAGEEMGEGLEFKCEVTLSIGPETFSRVATVAVSAGALTTTLQEPDAETILELAAATKPLSTEHSAPQDLTKGSPTAQPAPTTLPSSISTSPRAEVQETSLGSISWGSPPAEKRIKPSVGTVTSVGSAPACSLSIWSLPPQGTRGRALSIECQAQCPGNASVLWLQTPVALSHYQEMVSGSSSTLWLDHAEPQHQGHYQCVLLGPSSQVVSLQLLVLDDGLSTGTAVTVGTTVSLLGLILTSIVSCRLWKRFRSQYELP